MVFSGGDVFKGSSAPYKPAEKGRLSIDVHTGLSVIQSYQIYVACKPVMSGHFWYCASPSAESYDTTIVYLITTVLNDESSVVTSGFIVFSLVV